MIIRYQHPDDPEAAPPREYVFRVREELSPTAEAIELIGGEQWDNYDEFERKFRSSNRRAHRAALWAAMNRDDPNLHQAFEDLSYPANAVSVYYEKAELQRIRKMIQENTDYDDAERARLIDTFGLPEPDPEVAVPKDSDSASPPNETGTGSDDSNSGGQ